MKHPKSEGTLLLAGGALLGAAAIYLLDPEAGQRRRRRLAQAAENARHTVAEKWADLAGHAKDLTQRVSGETTGWRESAADSAHALADQAREIAHDLAHGAQSRASHLRQWGGHLWERAREAAGKLTHLGHHVHDDVVARAHEWGDRLSRRARNANRQARSWFGHEHHEGFGTATVTSTALTCCAVGAGMMYCLDPDRGRARRHYLYDKAGKLVRETGRTMRSVGSGLAHRARRFFHGSRVAAEAYIGGTQRIDSEQLVARCRAELGHYSRQAQQVQIMADADGTITLTGTIAREDVDGLLTLIHRVPGVTHVIDRLEVGERPNGAEGSRDQVVRSTATAQQ